VAFDVLSEFFFNVGIDVRLMCRRHVLDVAWCAFDVPFFFLYVYVGARRLMCAPGYLQEVG
jgi:hypothetical protein